MQERTPYLPRACGNARAYARLDSVYQDYRTGTGKRIWGKTRGARARFDEIKSKARKFANREA